MTALGTGDPRREAGAATQYFAAQPRSADQVRTIQVRLHGRDVSVVTAAGVFSAGHVDAGTAVLLNEVPSPPAGGDLLDLGCGWGPLALSMALAPPAATVWAVDVNERARSLVRQNAAALGLLGVSAVAPDEVPPAIRFGCIWSNPPIRIGKEGLHALLLTWLPRLSPGGSAWLVVQRNLGADSLHRWLQHELAALAEVERVGSSKGYRVLRVRARLSDLTMPAGG